MGSIHRMHKGKSPYWYAFFTGPEGKRICKSTKQKEKKKAEAVLQEWEQAADKARHGMMTESQARKVVSEIMERAGMEPVKFYSVDSWFAFWLSSKSDAKASSTSARYQGIVDRFLAFLGKRTGENLANINAVDIRDFRTQERGGGRSARTANFSIKIIRTAFNHALRLGYIPVNPCHALDQLGEEESKVEAFALSQINAILAIADADWRGAILMGCYAGMALEDAANITWDSIDLAEEIVTYKRGKTAGKAIMGLHPTLRDYLLRLPTHDEGKKPLFASLAGRDTSSLSKSFSRIMESAHIARPVTQQAKGAGRTRYALGFHSLRHTFVSDLARSGVAEDVRKKMAAHQTSAAHAVYTHHDAEVYRQAVAKLPAVTVPVEMS